MEGNEHFGHSVQEAPAGATAWTILLHPAPSPGLNPVNMAADDSMDVKTVLVTGGTSGIGLEAAKALCAKQAACTVLGSSREKGERWACREPRVCGGWPWRWGGLLRLAEAPCRAGTRRN